LVLLLPRRSSDFDVVDRSGAVLVRVVLPGQIVDLRLVTGEVCHAGAVVLDLGDSCKIGPALERIPKTYEYTGVVICGVEAELQSQDEVAEPFGGVEEHRILARGVG